MSLNLAVIVKEGAARHPDKPAIVAGTRVLSHAALFDEAARLAASLGRLGLTRGEHVALMMPNVPEFTVAYFACHLAGLVVVPLNVMLRADEVAFHLEDSDARALIVWHALVEQVGDGADRAPACRLRIVAGADASSPIPEGVSRLEALVTGELRIVDLPNTAPDDTAVLLYTSGTTGRPKGAELTHFNLFYNADLAGRLHGVDANAVALAVLPLFHSFGQTVIQNATLLRGGTLVLLPRFDALATFEAISQHRVTFFAGVPTMYFGLLHHPDATTFDLSSLRICASGGAPMPVEVMRRFDELHGANILEGYGLSETSPLACLNQTDRPKKPGSIGRPLWGVEFRLVADDGRVIEEPDVPGEIQIKGHVVMKGYYRRPDATAAAIVDGWFRTGDVARRDADGFYFIVDRMKDMILRGGYNVYPREVEEVLYRHPAVGEAAVIGAPHEALGEEVVAVVALKPGASVTAEELVDFARERLAAYKYPREVRFILSLPKGPTGKILKRAIRASW
ncbi:MAG: long-chain fatty acid--CoA ligase [Deltaproteobacteria bacterium]|nr:long-chain fatty acid--CoA ligase [Deltaproteobacteria bacterium]